MKPYVKTVYRTIKGSLSRFVAIFAIIALGVGFFSGLKVTMPSFLATGEKYYSDYKFYDFRLISTIGFSAEDIDKISKLDGVKNAVGAISQDVVVDIGQYPGRTARIHSITADVNELKLDYGRMPQKPNEVLLDGYKFGPEDIGTTLSLTKENQSKTLEYFKFDQYEVVGIIRSPLYLNFQRGTTNVGKGSLDFYAYIPEDAFDFEYFTESYVWYDTNMELYSDEYKDFASKKEKELEKQVEVIINDRYDQLISDKYQELYDAEDELNEQKADAIKDINDGLNELNDARKEIKDAREELNDAKEKLDDASKKISDGDKELLSAKKKITSGNLEIEDKKEELDSAKKQLDDGLTKANSSKDTLDKKLSELEESKKELETGIETLETKRKELGEDQSGNLPKLEATISNLKAMLNSLPEKQEGEDPEITSQRNSLNTQISTLETQVDLILAQKEGFKTIDGKLKELRETKTTVEAGIIEVKTGITEVNKVITDLDNKLTLVKDGYTQIANAKTEISKAQAQYGKGKKEIEKARKEYKDGLKKYNDALEEFEDGLKEFYDGLIEYEEGKNKFNTEIASASRLLEYGFRTLKNTDRPDVYCLGRDKNIGYVSFETDSKIVDGIASVFPLFFFAIAALVCSTTMSRMIGDERVQIGSMRAMGFSEFSIVMKYVIYSGSASVLGCVLGFMGGTRLFPYVIWSVYNVMYGFAPIEFRSSTPVFIISIAVSLLCSVGITVFTCLSDLKGTPAELVRPKAPPAGKRILLERIPFIWKKMKFLHKVSARNVFRFKKRMFMMILGISGCTSLLITGFGLRDSINDIVNIHYDNILKYEISITFDDKLKADEIKESMDEAKSHYSLTDSQMKYSLCRVENAKHTGKDMIRDVQIFVSDDPSMMEMISGINIETGEKMNWPGDSEIAISSKLSKKNNLKAGDTITLGYGDDGKEFNVKIAYVFENYIYHYAMMNKNTYEECFGKTYRPVTVLATYDKNNEVTAYDVSSYISGEHDVVTWSITSDMRNSFAETMKQLNAVVVLVIFCAAALAFIVLFNLNNINITERIREIATLKVMGFNRSETGAYVSRENIFLVIFGYIVGIPLGILLHAFVISQIEMDTVTFVVQIFPLSYVFSLAFVILFSLVVDFIMRKKIDKIHMAESLKSIE